MERDGRLDSLRFQIRQEKTLDLLVQHAEVTVREPETAPEMAAGDVAASEASAPRPDEVTPAEPAASAETADSPKADETDAAEPK